MTSTLEKEAPRRPDFLFLGSHPAVDFANTLVPPPGPDIEFLQAWQDVIDWMKEAKLSDGDSLGVTTAEEMKALEAVRLLRHAWRSVMSEIMAGHKVPHSFVGRINAILAMDTFSKVLHLDRKKHFYLDRTSNSMRGEKRALVILVQQIAEFLATAEFKYLRRCANTHTCVLNFYDTTKNHRRQWCSNSTCGNNHKVAEFRRRQRLNTKKEMSSGK